LEVSWPIGILSVNEPVILPPLRRPEILNTSWSRGDAVPLNRPVLAIVMWDLKLTGN
jgi:hypothetical protein